VIVAITNRRQMVASDVLASGDWTVIAELFGAAISKVRADIVQVREKDLDGGPLFALVRAALATGARVMVNDRVDVALAAGAYGVHLPERGMAIDDVRAIAPSLAIGVSRHSIDGVRSAAGADFIQLGPIWRSPGKGEPLGPLALEGARTVIGNAKLVAVGGIETPERVRVALRSGADAVAAVRAVWSGALAR
jgi:thiamine-phosphate pyrophosphorylase